jgi:hypothetical protein
MSGPLHQILVHAVPPRLRHLGEDEVPWCDAGGGRAGARMEQLGYDPMPPGVIDDENVVTHR